MGFFTSFLIICVLGLFSHHWYHKHGLSKGHLAWISYYTLLVIGGFLILDILIYVGVFNAFFQAINSIIPWITIENGKDYMWNSFKIIGIDWNINHEDNNLKYIAVLLFISYPTWFFAFKDISRKWFGGNRNRPHEKGLWYLFSSNKSPKNNNKMSKLLKKPE